ncbi:MAG: PAS domain S-box protein, partial [Chloroflexi bacterium]|nr:PAS domain S-box protein [Chloroflexota bacterium]
MDRPMPYIEQRYRSLLDSLEDGYFEVDLAGNFTIFNDSLCRLLGYSRSEMMGMNNRQYMDAENARRVFDTFNRVYRTGQSSKGFDWVIVRPDGTMRIVETSVSLIADDEGRPTGFCGIARDVTERKQAETELRRLKEFNESIVQQMAEGISVQDAAGCFTFINPAAAALLGYEPADLIGQHWTLVVPADQQPVIQAADERRLQGQADRYQVELLRRDGARVPVLISGSPRFEGDRLVGTLAVFTDISVQVQAARERERLLVAEREQRELAETLREVASALTSTLDLSQVLDRILVHLEQVVPYDSAGVLLDELGALYAVAGRGFPPSEQVVGQFYSLDDPLYQEIQRSQHPIYLPDVQAGAHFHRWGGTSYARGWMGVPLMVRGRVIGTLTLDSRQAGAYGEREAVVAQAFADHAAIAIENARLFEAEGRRRREAEALRRASLVLGATLDVDEVLEQLLDQISQVVPYDAANLMWIDAGQSQVTQSRGYDRAALDQFATLCLSVADLPNLHRMFVTRQPHIVADTSSEPEWTLLEPSTWIRSWIGAPIVVRDQVVAFLCLDSRTPGFYTAEHADLLGVFAAHAAAALTNARLFTETQVAYEQLKQTQAQLIQSAKLAAIGQLAAGVAHEINNPMTSVLGFAELMLKNMAPDDPQRPGVTIIASEARRVRQIVRGLLDFARQTPFQRQSADVNQVVQEALTLVRQRLGKAGVQVEEHYAADLPSVPLDISRIKQVLLNLIINALHAMPQGGVLTISSEQVGDEVVVRVQDTGVGIPAESLAH